MSAMEQEWPDKDRRDHALESVDAVIRNADAYFSRRRLKEARHALDLEKTRAVPTPAELRVLQAASTGLRPSEIAEVWGLSELTARDQMKKAVRRLGAKNRTQACCDAIRRGFIQVVGPDGPRPVLAATEVKALEEASIGQTCAEIANGLGVEEGTIKDRLRAARQRLRAKNTTHACCEAIRKGLIQ